MFILVADGKVAFVTDIDDVAWDTGMDMQADGECEEFEVIEAYEHEFNEEGVLEIDEYKITLEDCNKAEQYFRQ